MLEQSKPKSLPYIDGLSQMPKKNTSFKIISSPPADATANMATDQRLFEDFEKGLIPATFRIYSWSGPAITFGYRINPANHLDLKKYQKSGYSLARRPTGGGIVFHDSGEITFSAALPRQSRHYPDNFLDAYFFVARIILDFLKSLGRPVKLKSRSFKRKQKFNHHLCFEQAAPFEITLGGRKIVGLAQRRFKNSFCFQGTIKGVKKIRRLGKNYRRRLPRPAQAFGNQS